MDPLPEVSFKVKPNYYLRITSPAPEFAGAVFNTAGDQVGHLTYAVSPLLDCVYLYGITIEAPYRRKGYAVSVLNRLSLQYRVPITPVHTVIGAQAFWKSARKLSGHGIIIKDEIRATELEDEAQRWNHLEPVALQLKEKILQRLAAGDSWEDATGSHHNIGMSVNPL